MNRQGPCLHIALYHPEIPQNTGNIGRLCVGVQASLHLVHPLSFSTSEKRVRRAGLDYWKHLALVEHPDEVSFWQWAQGRRVHLFSKKVGPVYTQCPFQWGDVLLFGKETLGLPEQLIEQHGGWRIPMSGPTRSLNLSNAVAVVVYQALQRVDTQLFEVGS
jgi:tRNA (cytidine/uridine-2'-O-)-methyltransferase